MMAQVVLGCFHMSLKRGSKDSNPPSKAEILFARTTASFQGFYSTLISKSPPSAIITVRVTKSVKGSSKERSAEMHSHPRLLLFSLKCRHQISLRTIGGDSLEVRFDVKSKTAEQPVS
jgi:hypothetical protein